MGHPLRVLIVEDNPKDAALLVRELRRGGYDLTFERVETPQAMQQAIEAGKWDLVVSDYAMPFFSVQGALDILKQNNLDLPFIVVSGTVGEEVAIEALRAGAHDFMPKGQFTRLLPAIKRELREAAMRAEHRAVEDRLRHAQKIEALGQLTGGIAHDFNNLLAVIVGNLDLLLEMLDDAPDKQTLANAALKSALHGSELTKRLLAVARQQPLSVRIIDVNALLPGITAMLQRTLGEKIAIQVTRASDLWQAHADPTQVEDALLNLAINARDAMPEGGTIAIDTMNKQLDAQYAACHPEVSPGDYVMLSVTDTGFGMSPDIIERATEPFFTTKPLGKGTGLGLSMVHGFAKQSGGHLNIYSEVGHGTTVRLYLPAITAQTHSAPTDPTQAQSSSRGGESILVVDDNLDLRTVVVRSLNSSGYKTREAENGPAALRMFDAGEKFDMLFTDIGLPDGLNGYDLARLALQRQPDLKVLFTTGYAKTALYNDELASDPNRILHKPYRVEDLLEKIRNILDHQIHD
jgi:signal transduction histidine kinase